MLPGPLPARCLKEKAVDQDRAKETVNLYSHCSDKNQQPVWVAKLKSGKSKTQFAQGISNILYILYDGFLISVTKAYTHTHTFQSQALCCANLVLHIQL